MIARESRPISLGYVGPAPGEPHCDPGGLCDLSQPCFRTRHAERNAMDFARHWNIDIRGADLFTTDLSCLACAQRAHIEGISRVYYDRPYRIDSSEWLLERGIKVYRVLANGMITEHTRAPKF